jgi:hypothetical protein
MIIFLSRKYLRKHRNPKNWELGQQVHTILQTHVNSTVTIELRSGISERFNV